MPVIGRNYQDILTLPPGATDANGDIIEEVEVITSGASAEYGRADGGFTRVVTKAGSEKRRGVASGVLGGVLAGVPGGVAGGMPPTSPETAVGHASTILPESAVRGRAGSSGSPQRRLEEAALRVLADLAAGLLAAQATNGRFSGSVRTQALATWALRQAASREPRLRWVPEAARAAARYLETLSAGSAPEEAAARLVRVALSGIRAGPPDSALALDTEGALREIQAGAGKEDAASRLASRILRRLPRAGS
jgi:hypothetical protein